MDELNPVKIGDYVLATKYSDGDPGDAWALGFYDGSRNGRHFIKDAAGNQCRAGGYRHVGHISREVGAWLWKYRAAMEESPPGAVNLWSMLSLSNEDAAALTSQEPQ